MKDNPATGQDTAEKKLKTTETIATSIMTSIGKKKDIIDTAVLESLPGHISERAISSLDEAGLSGQDLGTGIGSIMRTSVGNLSKVGIEPSKAKSLVTNMTKSSLAGMKQCGLSKTDIANAVS